MRTKVKICGITNVSEIKFINDTDVDYIGFVFAESRRRITPEHARMLGSKLRADIIKCGVFTDHRAFEINEIAATAVLDIAQVHADMDEREISKISLPVWLAVNVKDSASINQINRIAKYKNVSGIVADSYVKGQKGGTGQTFNWDLLRGIDDEIFIILAGGLNSNNIIDAITSAHPDVVDISSGTEETTNGITQKSEEKVRSIVGKVKNNG